MTSFKIFLGLLSLLCLMVPAYCTTSEENSDEMTELHRADCIRDYQTITETPTVETILKMYDSMHFLEGEETLKHLKDRLHDLTHWAEKLYDDLIFQCNDFFPELSTPGEDVRAAFMKDLEQHIQITKEKLNKIK